MPKLATLAASVLLLSGCEMRDRTYTSVHGSFSQPMERLASQDNSIKLTRNQKGDIIVESKNKSITLLGASRLPSVVIYYPLDSLIVVENGDGSGQVSYADIYIDGKLDKSLIEEAIVKYLKNISCNIESDYINQHVISRNTKGIQFEFSIIDRSGECRNSSKQLITVKIP